MRDETAADLVWVLVRQSGVGVGTERVISMGPMVSARPRRNTIAIRKTDIETRPLFVVCGLIVDPIWEEQVRPFKAQLLNPFPRNS